MTSRTSFASSIAAALSLLLAAGAGCSLITKTDRSRIDETGGGGTGGGASTTTGGTGGATTAGGAGGGGTGGSTCTAECCAPSDCPSPANECLARTCKAGACGTAPVAAGILVSTQTLGDCQVIVCDGDGGTESEIDDTDLPDDGNGCTLDKCQDGIPKNTFAPAGEPCDVPGGTKCDGSGACVECLAPSDCASKVCNIAGACSPPTCADLTKNADETDVDCGGSCGATCTTGKACDGNADCLDHVCDAMTGKCAAPTCDDGVQNGDEPDVDCGGTLCGPTCGPGDGCAADLDCKGGLCSGSFCLPSCTDGVLNNGETGLDCGGPVCTSTCDDGVACAVASDCTSAFCADGVCCATACDTPCAACSAAAKGEGADGECGTALQGTDPHDDCGVSDPATCGDATGVCDGLGACEKWPVVTPCGDAASCDAGVQTNADHCDGLGACEDAGTLDCGLYACGPVTCQSACATSADCAPTAYCEGSACVPKKPVAAACAAAEECETGACDDGFCCDQACNGSCQACSVAAGGTADGTCSPIPSGQDPAGECGGTGLCDGAGSCKKATGQACILAAECLTGSCADGFCCNTPCVGLCQACSNLKKGSGADGSCGFVDAGLDPDDECPGSTACAGGVCALNPLGTSCAVNGECASGFCVDGFCCDTQCLGFCQACSNAKTGMVDGSCDDVVAGTDPDDECPGAGVCDGNLGCMP